ncbi:hypothetical protein ACKZDW_07410 [Ralstonia syzygii subsp. celebesensis]
MGFLHGGHLFVTGRLKDMMLFRGQCHYPNDIEATSGRAHAAVIPESGAAFSMQAEDDAGERLVIVQEVRRQASTIAISPPPCGQPWPKGTSLASTSSC